MLTMQTYLTEPFAPVLAWSWSITHITVALYMKKRTATRPHFKRSVVNSAIVIILQTGSYYKRYVVNRIISMCMSKIKEDKKICLVTVLQLMLCNYR